MNAEGFRGLPDDLETCRAAEDANGEGLPEVRPKSTNLLTYQ